MTSSSQGKSLPNDPMQAARLMIDLVRQGQGAKALGLARAAVAKFPQHPFVLRAASEAYASIGDQAKATSLAKTAIKAAPQDPGGYLHLSVCQERSFDEAGAVASVKKAAEHARQNPMVLGHIASMLSRFDENETALEIYKAILRLTPGDPQVHYKLSVIQMFLGNLEEAEASCDRALELDPGMFEVHMARARLRQQTEDRNHIDEMERVRKTVRKQPIEQAIVCYSLAKEYEDLGRYAESFERTKECADTYRKTISYSIEGDLASMKELVHRFDEETCNKAPAGNPSDLPLFVLGLPRSGTTLIERILTSHSQVASAGERLNFAQQISRLLQSENTENPDLSGMDLALQLDPARLGHAYVESVPAKYKTGSRFVDKLPANFLNLGFICRALPNAKIIELTRHPMDACYAMYKTLFQGIYPATYDLDELAQYYIQYRELMDHWRDRFPRNITRVSYEEMVAVQELQSRKLLDTCGLAWEDTVLNFHKTKSASTTASAAQIRKPVYSSSVQLWRRYEKELAPLASRLTAAGIDIS